jgi:hypothetical protein
LTEAIGQADDGWGPYTPILAFTGKPNELIPGKYCQSKGLAFYSVGGKELPVEKFKHVQGHLLPDG